ncbi:MAG TPA: acetyl-CoA carboxylase biotin carboxyl carrier protein [Thermodesulfobacteriota bacterium]|nr:acetyl-CoA carboxylase biotin carboxyl carrier protein [Thermodesulfobacteriota bacterium]
MDIKDLKSIYKFLKTTDIVELELEDSRGKVKIKRAGADALIARPPVLAATPEAPAKEEKNTNIKTITSPMVGTFYRSPSPEAQPFVEIGSMVKFGQAVCIIEAMKIMNEVESEVAGKIISILVEDGQPVEYGEPLFHVE